VAAPTVGGTPESADRADSNASTLLRLGWMLIGNAVIAVLACVIWIGPAWTLTFKDALYWIAAAGTVLLRWLDVFRHHGQTADGQPATPRHFRRYAIGFGCIVAAIWACVQSFELANAE